MTRFLPLLLALSIANVFADTIKLKSGEMVEGRVVQSDAKSITVEVHYSATIVDDETIARSDIADLSIQAPDEVAFQKIGVVKTPDTALSPKVCQTLIDNQLQPFLDAFPSSSRTVDVQKEIKAIQLDQERLSGGDVKISGIWYDHSSFAAEKYQIEAASALELMKQQIDGSNFPAAMNTFDLLQHSYPDSTAYTESVPLAVSAAGKLQQQLTFEIENLPETKKQRQATIDRTPIEDQTPIKRAMAEEDARAAATVSLAQKNNQRFFTISAFDDKGLALMQISVGQTLKDLQKIDLKALAEKVRLVRQGNEELAMHELPSAATTLEQLKTAWPQYEGLSRMASRLKAADDANLASEVSKKTTPSGH